jgi:hypothetical protein
MLAVLRALHRRRVKRSIFSSRLARLAEGQRVSGFVYGTIVALSVIVAEAPSAGSGEIASVVGITCVVFWLAHVYAHALGHSLDHHQRVSLREIGTIARREASIIEAALLPVGALVLGRLGVMTAAHAVWLAFGIGLGELVIQGLAVARVEHLGRLGTAALMAANVGLGLALVALKLVVGH